MSKKSYIFLGDNIYSPECIDNTFGLEIEVTKTSGSEIWFNIKSTGQKGYVVGKWLIAENNTSNKMKVIQYMAKRKEAAENMKTAREFRQSIKPIEEWKV